MRKEIATGTRSLVTSAKELSNYPPITVSPQVGKLSREWVLRISGTWRLSCIAHDRKHRRHNVVIKVRSIILTSRAISASPGIRTRVDISLRDIRLLQSPRDHFCVIRDHGYFRQRP
jgi:hypothetical protein